MIDTNKTTEFNSFCRKYFNAKVKEYFKDIPASTADDWALTKNNDRAIVKRLCTHTSQDSLPLTIARIQLYKFFVEGLFEDLIVGYPLSQLGTVTRYENQIIFHYSESQKDALDNKRKPVRKQISFRYREPLTTKATVEALALALKIKINSDSSFKQWECGESLYTYKDLDKGYNFKIYAKNEANAKSLIGALYSVQDVGLPDWENKLVGHFSKKNYNPTGKQTVLGKSYSKVQLRPKATVKFRWCELILKDYPERIVLVSKKNSIKSRALEYID